jgi:lipopolysaccharide biosynthesis regulator YciM
VMRCKRPRESFPSTGPIDADQTRHIACTATAGATPRRRIGRNAAALEAFRSALQLDEMGEVTVAMRDLLRSADAPGPDDLAARHDLLVAALVRKARAPHCARCGAEASRRQWRCRRCGAFDPHR